MKHLKIYFAVLFFSFLGGINTELTAQENSDTFTFGVYSLEGTNQSIKSPDGTYTFEISAKKMKIFKTNNQQEVWSVDYSNAPACSFAITEKGSFDIISCGGVNDGFSWKSGLTEFSRTGGMSLKMQNDGNLVVYSVKNPRYGIMPRWATGTCGGVLGGCGEVGSR
jgi:hypothetical protein